MDLYDQNEIMKGEKGVRIMKLHTSINCSLSSRLDTRGYNLFIKRQLLEAEATILLVLSTEPTWLVVEKELGIVVLESGVFFSFYFLFLFFALLHRGNIIMA